MPPDSLLGTSRHQPRPGIRHAAMCPHRDKDNVPCGTREFFSTREEAQRWRCPTHGVGAVQENRKYFGQSTS
jgi:hypothetical protein